MSFVLNLSILADDRDTSPTPNAEHIITNLPILHTPDGEDLAPSIHAPVFCAPAAVCGDRSCDAATEAQEAPFPALWYF